MALHPVFTPTGKLAFSGEGRYGQRIYVGGKAISPDGLFASAPTFCSHPDGVKAVYAVGVGKNTDLVASGETGGGLVRLTQNQGRNGYPACSPDGRLVAFFSTRTSGRGARALRHARRRAAPEAHLEPPRGLAALGSSSARQGRRSEELARASRGHGPDIRRVSDRGRPHRG